MNDLRPSKDLLDHNFKGYKLSLTSSPVYKLDLPYDIDCAEPSEEQYSFLHQREFSLHNHLHYDWWNPINIYFITKEWNVNKVNFDSDTLRLSSMKDVFKVPLDLQRSGGEFNVSLCFPSKELVVISDGSTTVHIVETPPREEPNPWKLLHSEKLFEEKHPFRVVDSKLWDNKLHCLFLHVDLKVKADFEEEKKENKNASKFETVLYWCSFSTCDARWKLENKVELRGKGCVQYASLECTGEAIYVASEEKFKFPHLPSPADNGQTHPDDVTPDYEWEQTWDELHIRLKNVNSEEGLSVAIHGETLSVRHQGSVLLEGSLVHPVDADVTTWSVEDSMLEIVLQKKKDQMMWQKLFKDDKIGSKVYIGKEIVNPEVAEEINQRLSHLTSETTETGSAVINDWQMEECDAFEEESRTLFRYKSGSPEPSHKVAVGGAQWLFTLRLGGEGALAACIRADVDGCVWQPLAPDGDRWQVDHVGTFLAFGYVLASKVGRKFTVAPGDLSYVSVLDETGHVIMYRKGVSIRGELRNRKTGQQVESIATQRMINLQTKDNILGAVATSDYIFVLTTHSVYTVHVKE